MTRLLHASLVAVFVAPVAPSDGESSKRDALPAKLTVRCLNKDKVLPPDGAMLEVELTFACATDKGGMVRRGEYRLMILDKDGRQLERTFKVGDPDHAISLRKGAVKDTFTALFPASDDIRAGEDYYLVFVVRDKAGMVRFKGRKE